LWHHSFFLWILLLGQGEAARPPLVVHAFPIAEANGQVSRVTIVLGNDFDKNLTTINVTLIPDDLAKWTLPVLAPGEWKSNTISVNSGTGRSLVAFVEYTSDGSMGSMAVPLQLPESSKSWWTAVGQGLIPVIAGALITLVGVVITSMFNLSKERVTARLQWKRFLVEHFDAQYTEFLARCAGTIDLTALNSHFEHLDESALVPDKTRQRILAGLKRINTAATPEAKRNARDALLVELRSEILEPFR
jgi:hypothetical protein